MEDVISLKNRQETLQKTLNKLQELIERRYAYLMQLENACSRQLDPTYYNLPLEKLKGSKLSLMANIQSSFELEKKMARRNVFFLKIRKKNILKEMAEIQNKIPL